MAAAARFWPAVSRRVSAGTQLCRTAVRPGISTASFAVPAGTLAGSHGAADPDLPGSGDSGHALLLPSDRIAAIVYANQVSSKRDAGDYIGAAHASKQARMWTIVSLAVGVAVLAIVVIAAVASSGSSSNYG